MPFLAELQSIHVSVVGKSVVVVNPRTGTIVSGSDLSIDPVTIYHKNLVLSIDNFDEKQMLSKDKKPKATIAKVIELMSEVGFKGDEVVGLLQALSTAGALNGKLIIM